MRTNILEYLEETAARVPEKIAFSDGTDSLSFGELLRASQAIGTKLIELGLRREPVLILMDKHPSTVAAFLGVVYAGGFYVPLDSEMPKLRAEAIAANVGAKYLICDSKNRVVAEALLPGRVLLFDEISAGEPDLMRLSAVRAGQIDTDIIYIVFTSGSTGVPKGVAACHRSVIDYAESLCEALPFDGDTVFGNQTPLYFDAPLKEILPTLKYGATTYFIPKKLFMFPVKLVEYLNTYKINTICWVVSALTVISSLGALEKVKPQYLRLVTFGSEVFPQKQFNIWYDALPGVTFYNLYGPTEATGMSTYYRVEGRLPEGEVIPIGKPFRNTRITLIGEDGREVGEGETGEIYISGTCVTLGYYNNPEKTTEAFVQNPLNSVCREIVYKTGDLARRNERGELIFISRKDFQIKHMGHRIELGEIEAAVDRHDGVARSCCIYDEENRRIMMYYIGDATETEVAAYLRGYLPRYMLPALVTRLDALPLTPNGKLDRRTLREMSATN